MQSQESIVKFDKYINAAKRRWVAGLGVFFPVFLISVLTSSLKKPSYEAQGKILFQKTNTISSLTGVGKEIGNLEPVVQDMKTHPLNTEAEVIRSVPIVEQTINRLNLQDSKGMPLKIEQFMDRLTVKDIRGTDIIQISYKDEDAQIAAKVVNTLMSVYLEHNRSYHKTETSSARKFIENQLPIAEEVAKKAEAELADFKNKNNIVSLQEEATQGVQMVADLQKKIGENKAQMANITAQIKDIRNQLGMTSQQAVALTSVSQSTGVQDITKQIEQLETEIARKRTIFQDIHPEIVNLENQLIVLKEIQQQRIQEIPGTAQVENNSSWQMGQLQQQLTAKLVELESNRLGLAAELTSLLVLEANHKQRLSTIPQLEQQQDQLERKVQAAKSTYSLLLEKLQETQIAENQNTDNARIISPAKAPEKPASSPVKYYLAFTVLGILASLATIYFLEIKDKTIKTLDEVKELLELTILGVIPTPSKPKKLAVADGETQSYSQGLVLKYNPRSPMGEAYRMLRANLKFVSADKELKIITITSSVNQEGKSTVAANLALAMAQIDRKVLLIDGDMYRSSQDKIWELPESPGLSNVIVGQIEIMKAIKKVANNLDLLPAGILPATSTSILDTQRMEALLDSFASYYDCVIIDAPSLTSAVDAVTLGQMADGVLLVVRPGVVDYTNLSTACDLLSKSGQNVIGQVVNAVVSENENQAYYYQEEFSTQPSPISANIIRN
ncbi:MAG: polysaccharide biosynthesis tyrosine autokinase [Nostocaceae cyanobacterium]|nr:polysaccharide biosynthesis tyrosine autokinase [Nostocaceae cyanobacterium]